MVAQNGAWVWDVIYSPFGAVSAIFDSTTKLDMRFPGQWFQLESGLAYNWHRHYDASLGRYVQPDPIGYAGGRNLFSYVSGNPLAYIDIDGQNIGTIVGLCAEAPIVCVAAGAVGGAAWWDDKTQEYDSKARRLVGQDLQKCSRPMRSTQSLS